MGWEVAVVVVVAAAAAAEAEHTVVYKRLATALAAAAAAVVVVEHTGPIAAAYLYTAVCTDLLVALVAAVAVHTGCSLFVVVVPASEEHRDW